MLYILKSDPIHGEAHYKYIYQIPEIGLRKDIIGKFGHNGHKVLNHIKEEYSSINATLTKATTHLDNKAKLQSRHRELGEFISLMEATSWEL